MGLLDSGKTSVIKESLLNPAFQDGERTLIMTSEEGEIGYDEDFLASSNSIVMYQEKIDHRSFESIKNLEYDRIFLELNGIEDIDDIIPCLNNHGLEIAQTLSIFDGSKFRLYNTNFKQFIYNQIKRAECCIINRFDDVDEYLYIRNNFKAINPMVELIFENSKREIVDFKNEVLFDLDKDVLDVADHDFGMWYIDVLDHPKRYDNHKVSLNIKMLEDLKEYKKACIMGRLAMVCCADDMAELGIICTGIDKSRLKQDAYYNVQGVLHIVENDDGSNIIMLNVSYFDQVDVACNHVYFN